MDHIMPNQSEERRKKNEEDFKSFNVSNRQAVEMIMDEESKQSFPLGMVCECSNANCFDRIELSVARRRQIRKDPNAYVVTPNHVDGAIERVVEKHADYYLVKKIENL